MTFVDAPAGRWLTDRGAQIGADADPSDATMPTRKAVKRRCFLSQMKEPAALNGGRPAMDVVVLLVKEITRSKDETIQAKDQLIEFLMTRKFAASCADGE